MCTKTFLNPYLLLKFTSMMMSMPEIIQPYCVMKKISNLTTFAQTLKDFTNVVESQGPF